MSTLTHPSGCRLTLARQSRGRRYPQAMCAGCAMAAASAASGFRTWMQNQNISWLTPQRMRRLTIGAICTASVVSTIGFSGSTPPAVHARAPAQQHVSAR